LVAVLGQYHAGIVCGIGFPERKVHHILWLISFFLRKLGLNVAFGDIFDEHNLEAKFEQHSLGTVICNYPIAY
jgi:hypothetical protein